MLSAVAVCLLGVGWLFVGTPAASADVWVVPPQVAVPAAVAGTATVTGGVTGVAVGTGAAAATTLTAGQAAAAFGLSAFGTCQVLGYARDAFHIWQGQSCTGGVSTIANWLGFGASADDRSVSAGYVNAPSLTGPAARVQSFSVTWPSGGMAMFATCTNPATGAAVTYPIQATPNGSNFGSKSSDYSSPSVSVSAGCQRPTGDASTATGSGLCQPSYSPATVVAGVGCAGANVPVGAGSTPWVVTSVVMKAPTPGCTYSTYYTCAGTGPSVATWTQDTAPNTPWSGTVTITCKGNGAAQTLTAPISAFTPTANGQAPPISVPACPTGTQPTQVVQTGGRGGTTEVTVTQPTYTPTAIGNYPSCTGSSTGTCLLDLQKHYVDGTVASCFVVGASCQTFATEPTSYSCSWGPYSVPIAWCQTEYGNNFTAQPVGTGNPNTAPTPSTGTGTSSQPFPTTGPSIDPRTGQPYPTGSGSPNPAPDPDDSFGDCMGSGWSWNPVSWVYIPVKCSLRWAFVPSQATWNGTMGAALTSLANTGPGQWFTAAGGLVTSLPTPGSGSCNGPTINLSFPEPVGNITLRPLDACDPPVSFLRLLIFSALSVSALFGTAVVCLRLVAASFGLQLGWFARESADA